MRGRNGAVVVVVVILVSSLSFALPGAGTIGYTTLENLERGGTWEPTGGSGWDPVDHRSSEAMEDHPSPPLTGIESLHRAGIEGDGVTVGVIGDQFGADERSLGDSVAEHRQFATGNRLKRSSGSLLSEGNHDTAVAEIVAQTAPGADLYLADLGDRTTPKRYAAAMNWLLEKDVDVVVDAASYFPATPEGMHRMNAVASTAADRGVVFVTSAGNYADRHWAGTAASDEWVEFAPGTPYNSLGDGKVSGPTSLRLYWEGDAEFDLYLYRSNPGEDTLVAKSATNQSGPGSHSEAIDATLPEGNYYVAVRGGPGANDTSLDLFAAEHEFTETSDEGGMVAPATAENVIAVGAIDTVTGKPRPYSSTGASLDISAPDGAHTSAAGELYGSSASAPLVAGTVALMISQNESLTPTATQETLRTTATHVNGQRYLDTAGAVDAVSAGDEQYARPVTGSTGNETHSVGEGTHSVPTHAGTKEGRDNESETTESPSLDTFETMNAGSEPASGVYGD